MSYVLPVDTSTSTHLIFFSDRTIIRMRTLLRFAIALSCWLQARHLVQAVNVTVADTDPAIQYQPEEWWFSSTNLCSTCLNPGLSSSFHEGVNPISLGPTAMTIRLQNLLRAPRLRHCRHQLGKSPMQLPLPQRRRRQLQRPPILTSQANQTRTLISRKEASGRSTWFRGWIPTTCPRTKRLHCRTTSRASANYAAFCDCALTIPDLLGSAVYLFAAQLPRAIGVNETSSDMNITVLSTMSQPPLSSHPIQRQLPFQDSLFSLKVGLVEGLHQLVVQLGDNSTFVFDHLVYTTESEAFHRPTELAKPDG